MSRVTIGDISIDCAEPEKLRDFYADMLGWNKCEMYGCPAVIGEYGLVVLFVEPECEHCHPTWPEEDGKEQKQMHFDFMVNDMSSAIENAVRLGATKPDTQYGDGDCVTMLDPAGHPFCLCKRNAEKSEFDLYYELKGYPEIPCASINIDCPDTRELREFYAQLTGWDTDFHWTALVADNGMVVHFMQADFEYVPPVWPEEPGCQQKQKHFNFQVDDLMYAVDEAIALGAKRSETQYKPEHYVVMLDPVGHPFCLCQKA
jgi:predicted enzyme related to lactoylglutathione lyase